MWVVHMRFNLRCGLPAPASLAGWLNSDVERLLSYVQFSKAKDSNRCNAVIPVIADMRKTLNCIPVATAPKQPMTQKLKISDAFSKVE